MKDLIDLVKLNIVNVRKEMNFGLMMDKTQKFYSIELETSTLLSYVLNNDYNDIIDYFNSLYDKSKNENYNIEKFAKKILSYINLDKDPLKMPLDLKAKNQIENFSNNVMLVSPIYISLQICNVCNLKCRHCYNDSNSDNSDFVKLEKLKSVIDELAEAKVFMIGITGGEPLLHPNIFEIINYATSKKILVNLNTNGTLLNNDLAIKLKGSGLNSIKISIDGSREKHNYIRNNESAFDRTINAVAIARDAGLKPEIYFVVMKHNIHDIDYMLRLASKMNVDINVRRFIPMGRGANELENILYHEDVQYLMDRISQYNNKNITVDRCYITDNRRGNCAICNRTVATITTNGNVFTCPYIQFEELRLGNINEESFKQVYSRLSTHPFVNYSKLNFKEPCRSCDDFGICKGGCRGTAYVLNNKEPYSLDFQCKKI